jgi:DNA-binding MarR family transcriptional regulator
VERELQERIVTLIRTFGLHHPERTPCGQPVAVSEAHALTELARGGPLSQKELSRRLELEKSTISRLVGNLERRDWVVRERDAEDSRVLLLRLTEQGRRISERIAAARAETFSRVFDQIPPKEREHVLRALDVLVRAAAESETRRTALAGMGNDAW